MMCELSPTIPPTESHGFLACCQNRCRSRRDPRTTCAAPGAGGASPVASERCPGSASGGRPPPTPSVTECMHARRRTRSAMEAGPRGAGAPGMTASATTPDVGTPEPPVRRVLPRSTAVPSGPGKVTEARRCPSTTFYYYLGMLLRGHTPRCTRYCGRRRRRKASHSRSPLAGIARGIA